MGFFDKLKKRRTGPTPAPVSAPISTPVREKPMKPGVQFAFLDLETPNSHNDRVCSMAVIRTDGAGNVIGSKYSLVDPDAEFDARNVSVHGITEFDVHGSPTFPAAWVEFAPLVRDAVIVAHNAQFDLNVLDKAMTAYGIEHGSVEYACTMKMAQEQMPDIGSGLENVCVACGVSLGRHHNALDDAKACMDAFFVMGMPEEWNHYVPPAQRKSKRPVYNVEKSESSKSHNELVKLASDIIADGHVTLEEAIGLKWWLGNNTSLADDVIANRLISLLSGVLEDGVIDPDEETELLDILGKLVDPSASDNAVDDIDGVKFCLTGDFDFGSKDEVAARLESLGGIRLSGITRSCGLVIIGARGSAAYAHGTYGSKVKKAMELQANGFDIRIIAENDCPWL